MPPLIRRLEEGEVDAEREVEAKADVGVVEVEAGDVAHAVEAVEDGVAVDPEQGRRFLGAAAGVEEGLEGADQVGAVLAVVGDQGGEGLVVEGAQLRQSFGREDQPVDAEVVEAGQAAGCRRAGGP